MAVVRQGGTVESGFYNGNGYFVNTAKVLDFDDFYNDGVATLKTFFMNAHVRATYLHCLYLSLGRAKDKRLDERMPS